MKTWLISAHGEIPNVSNKFKLGPNQYVVFAQSCGNIARKSTTGTLWPMRSKVITSKSNRVQALLRSSKRLLTYIRSGANKTKYPVTFRDPIILTPGKNVVNMKLQFSNSNNPRLQEEMGVYNVQEAGYRYYSYRHPKSKKTVTRARKNSLGYLWGRGKSGKLSNIVKALGSGVFFVQACRVGPGNQKSNINAYERQVTGEFKASGRRVIKARRPKKNKNI